MKIAMDEKNVKSFAEVRCAKSPVGMDFKDHYFFLSFPASWQTGRHPKGS